MSTSTWAPDRSIETISRGPKDENRWLKGHSFCFLLLILRNDGTVANFRQRPDVEPDCTIKFRICPCPTVRGVLIERTLLCTELQEIASRSGFSQTGSGNGSEHGACSRAILTHFILGYGVTWSHHRNGTSTTLADLLTLLFLADPGSGVRTSLRT